MIDNYLPYFLVKKQPYLVGFPENQPRDKSRHFQYKTFKQTSLYILEQSKKS